MYLPPIENTGQITKDPTLLAIKPWRVVLIGAAILYLVPAQAVLEQPSIGSAIEWFASLIPSIARWTELSPFPANTKLFAVFVWVMIPVQGYWLWSSKAAHTAFLARSKTKPAIWRQQLLDLIRSLIVLLPILGLGVFWAIVDSPPCKVCVNTVGWAQLFIGCSYSFCVSALGAMCLWQFTLVLNTSSSKEKHHA